MGRSPPPAGTGPAGTAATARGPRLIRRRLRGWGGRRRWGVAIERDPVIRTQLGGWPSQAGILERELEVFLRGQRRQQLEQLEDGRNLPAAPPGELVLTQLASFEC